MAATLKKNVEYKIHNLKKRGITPCLSVIRVGDNPASKLYVSIKREQCSVLGIIVLEYCLPKKTEQKEVLKLINTLNMDSNVHGILVQLPLPDNLDTYTIINALNPEKDVDGLTVVNAGKLSVGKPSLVPCTPLGCLLILKHVLGDLNGNNAVIVGRSNLVGKPIALLLLQENCTVTVTHSQSQNIEEICRQANILIVAVGKPSLVKKGWVKTGATVIDVGINKVHDSKTGKSRVIGDVDFESVKNVAGAITPVPGGVGPMTVACLLENTVQAIKQ